MKALVNSATLYVGNLAFSTRLAHIRSHFSQLGRVKTIHLGLDRMRKTPCGFCFVEYYSREDALASVSLLSSTKLDGNVIRVELDAGFQPGRQYGRGQKGGQVRDDRKPPMDTTRKRERGEEPPPIAATQVATSPGGGESHGRHAAASANDGDDEETSEPAAKRSRQL
jgi:nuclear cap-binding protein subunit 2